MYRRLISFISTFFVSAARLGERVPQEVPRGGRSRAGEAGQEGGAGVADQGDAAHRLRTRLRTHLAPVRSDLPPTGTLRDRWFRRDNRLYFSRCSLCRHASASFCKAHRTCGFNKDHHLSQGRTLPRVSVSSWFPLDFSSLSEVKSGIKQRPELSTTISPCRKYVKMFYYF